MANHAAAVFIERKEGRRKEAYQDSVGIWTIGVGHTGPEVKKGLIWTDSQIDEAFAHDLDKAETGIKPFLKHAASELQMAAFLSFTFNLGISSFANSTLLTMFNQGQVLACVKEFPRWDHAGGIEVKGLLLRRFEEGVMFLQGS